MYTIVRSPRIVLTRIIMHITLQDVHMCVHVRPRPRRARTLQRWESCCIPGCTSGETGVAREQHSTTELPGMHTFLS